MEEQVAYEEFLDLIKGRRTIRAIKPDPIPDEMVMKLVEAARWAPTGFNMQFVELMVLREEGLRRGVKQIVEEWATRDFYPLEATRETWQGEPWTLEKHGPVGCPLAPVYILIMGDTRRKVGLPMNARYETPKADSIFETSLANAFMYLWLAAHSLGLAAQPVSSVKNARVQGPVKHLLNLPDHIYVYEMLAVGKSALGAPPATKLMRHLEEMVHYDGARDDEFLDNDQLRKQVRKLRAGNVARHTHAGKIDEV
jgi:nitroreductase